MTSKSDDHILVVIARAGTPLGNGAIITLEALRQMAAVAVTPHIRFREESGDLVWDGPLSAYEEYFQSPSAKQEADLAIQRAMRRD